MDDEGDICGVVVSVRKNQDRVAIWTASSKQEKLQKTIGKKLREVLKLGKNDVLKYHNHYDIAAGGNSFKAPV